MCFVLHVSSTDTSGFVFLPSFLFSSLLCLSFFSRFVFSLCSSFLSYVPSLFFSLFLFAFLFFFSPFCFFLLFPLLLSSLVSPVIVRQISSSNNRRTISGAAGSYEHIPDERHGRRSSTGDNELMPHEGLATPAPGYDDDGSRPSSSPHRGNRGRGRSRPHKSLSSRRYDKENRRRKRRQKRLYADSDEGSPHSPDRHTRRRHPDLTKGDSRGSSPTRSAATASQAITRRDTGADESEKKEIYGSEFRCTPKVLDRIKNEIAGGDRNFVYEGPTRKGKLTIRNITVLMQDQIARTLTAVNQVMLKLLQVQQSEADIFTTPGRFSPKRELLVDLIRHQLLTHSQMTSSQSISVYNISGERAETPTKMSRSPTGRFR